MCCIRFNIFWPYLSNCPFHHRTTSQGCSVDLFVIVAWIGEVVLLHLFTDGITLKEQAGLSKAEVHN